MSEQESRAEGTVVDHTPDWVDVIDWIIDDIQRASGKDGSGDVEGARKILNKCAKLADRYNDVTKGLASMFPSKRGNGTGYADAEGCFSINPLIAVEGAVCPDCVGEGVRAPEIDTAPDASLLEKNREYKEFLERLLHGNKKEDE